MFAQQRTVNVIGSSSDAFLIATTASARPYWSTSPKSTNAAESSTDGGVARAVSGTLITYTVGTQ